MITVTILFSLSLGVPCSSTWAGSAAAEEIRIGDELSERGGESNLPTKLDPSLAMIVEQARGGDPSGALGDAEAAVVSVMVALSRPASKADVARLTSAGMTVRSEIGDILTGTVPVHRLEAVAADPNVVAIEGSRPMEPDRDAMTE